MKSFIQPVYAAITNPALTNPSAQSSPNYVNTVLQNVFSLFMVLGVIYFIWHFVFAGYHYMGAQGDSKKIEIAQTELTNAMIGLGVVFVVFAILKLIGTVAGIKGLDTLQFTLPSL
ncbi:MAG: hypothetical protein NTY75_03575 [Candidatus Shapirobacteria bacterium]|nr:hypothetical protein [Candidatus Shapirobacteria bacterium]